MALELHTSTNDNNREIFSSFNLEQRVRMASGLLRSIVEEVSCSGMPFSDWVEEFIANLEEEVEPHIYA